MTPIPFGKFKGQPLASRPTTYILWILTLPTIRKHYPSFCRAALDHLRARLHRAGAGAVEAELSITHSDPELW